MHERGIQFEWPSEKIFELTPEKETLQLSSLVLVANDKNQIVSVQAKLTNGMSSPLYRSLLSQRATGNFTTQTIEFSSDVRVRSIAGQDDGMTQITALAFKDLHGREIGKF